MTSIKGFFCRSYRLPVNEDARTSLLGTYMVYLGHGSRVPHGQGAQVEQNSYENE